MAQQDKKVLLQLLRWGWSAKEISQALEIKPGMVTLMARLHGYRAAA